MIAIAFVCLSASLLHSQATTRPAPTRPVPSPENASLGELDLGSDAKAVLIASFPGMLLGGTVVDSKRIVVLTSPAKAKAQEQFALSASLRLLDPSGKEQSTLEIGGVKPVANHDIRIAAVHSWGKRSLAIVWANSLYRVRVSEPTAKRPFILEWSSEPLERAVLTGAVVLPGDDLLVYGAERLEETSIVESRGIPIPVVARVSPKGKVRWVSRLRDRPRGRWQHAIVDGDSFVIVGTGSRPKRNRLTPLAIRYSLQGKEVGRWSPEESATAFTTSFRTAWHISSTPKTADSPGSYRVAVNGYNYGGRGHTGDGMTTLVFLNEQLAPLHQVAFRGSDTGHRAFFLEHDDLILGHHRTSYSGPNGRGHPRIVRGTWGQDAKAAKLVAHKITPPKALRIRRAQRFGDGWVLFGNTVKSFKQSRGWVGLLTL